MLEKAAALDPKLEALVARGLLGGYDQPARYLPTKAVQEQRRAALPDPGKLRAALERGARHDPVQGRASSSPSWLTWNAPGSFPRSARRTSRVRRSRHASDRCCCERGDHWTGLVTLTGVKDAAALAQLAAQVPGTTLLDLKQASEDLVAHQRERILWCLAVSAVLLVIVVFVALRDASRVRRVLAPMALTTLIIVALFHAAGVSLSLFHLIALVLAAGLGLDYALFFEHAADDPPNSDARCTPSSSARCRPCWYSRCSALSTLPVLRAIGITVAAGVVEQLRAGAAADASREPTTDGR